MLASRRTVVVALLLIPTFASGQRSSAPIAVTVAAGASVQLEFNTNTAVVWSLDEPASGAVSPSGLYTAPVAAEGPQTDTVRVTSATDRSKQRVFVVTVRPSASISPSQATVLAGGTLQFAANIPVGWSVAPSVGSMDAQGLYSAPAQLQTTQMIQVIATSVADPGNVAVAELTVRPQPVVIEPATATVLGGQSMQFSANSAVAWSLAPAVGTVSGTGLYAAPAQGVVAQTVTLTAVSLTDETNVAIATIQLLPALTLTPDAVGLLANESQQFVASDAVTWSLSPPVGSIDNTGRYTAPADNLGGQIVSVLATRATPPYDTAAAKVTLKTPESLTFNIWISGPRSVAQGRMAIVAAGVYNIVGSASKVRASIANLPPNSRGYIIVNVTRYPDAANTSLDQSLGVKVITTPQTPLGRYNMTLTYAATASDGTKVERTADVPLEVRQPASPMQKLPFPPDVPLPAIEQWEANMLKYGKKQVDLDHIGCCGSFTGPWYYDGARAFLQMADYTGNDSFLDFARRINEAYRDNSIITGGSRKYAVYPHGLREFYLRFGDELSRDALRALQENPGYTYRPHWGAPWNASREMAFGLSVHIVAESVGLPRHQETSHGFEPGETIFDENLAVVMGHFEQWFISDTAKFVYPFMVGLSAEALIDYYEVSHDPEVPWLLKLAADKMYPNPLTWDETSESMMIVEEYNGVVTRGPAPDLNMMIAPLYGWVFQQTGDVKYRNIGDRIFSSGVKRAYLDGGKQFTQNYRWSFKYLEWRKAPVSP